MVLFNLELVGVDKEIHSFSNGLCPKVNVMAQMKYELAYYDIAVQYVSHSTTGPPPVFYYYFLFKLYQSIYPNKYKYR